MILADYHVHTTFCDGENSPKEMVQAALEKGLSAIGFSGHSYVPFDESYCMSIEGTRQYRQEISALKKKYAGKIRILCGIEQDIFSDAPEDSYDYVIGSAHYVFADGEYVSVDDTVQILQAAVEKHFGGDIYAIAEAYFETVSHVWERTGCNIIGHFDLFSKFNEKYALFDPMHPRYVAAWKRAADRLLTTGAVFEINTGAISRGYRATPFPARDIMRYLSEHGARFILSGDSHSAKTLCYQFEKWQTDGLLDSPV